jgi:C1A family cysteine protease
MLSRLLQCKIFSANVSSHKETIFFKMVLYTLQRFYIPVYNGNIVSKPSGASETSVMQCISYPLAVYKQEVFIMKLKKSLVSAMSLLAFSLVSQTYAMEFGKPVLVPVKVTKAGTEAGFINGGKRVALMNLKLTEQQQSRFMLNMNNNALLQNETSGDLPAKADVGMNKVPVLDQGQHGTCVTFAVTAALDAALGKGDYISQLCNLELGSYLEDYSFRPGGWDGSWGSYVYDQIETFGLVSKNKQFTKGCAGVSNYPVDQETNTGNKMDLKEFKIKSEEPYSDAWYWVSIADATERMDNEQNHVMEQQVFHKVKSTLAKGNRVTFGTMIVTSPYCGNQMACASHNAEQDTWVITDGMKRKSKVLGGHEMVIIGYDDNAVAKDNEGKEHKGLFTLRNSWGTEVGDNGNYYMSYDYFKAFYIEAAKVAKPKSSRSNG